MTQRLVMLGFVLFCTACATAPVSYHGSLGAGPQDAYSCAMQQLNMLGYTVEDADRDAGFIRGRKQTSGLGTVLFTGKNYHDVLTVAVFQDPSTKESTLRVTAAQVQEQALGLFGGNEQGMAPSDSGKGDATNLLSRCGVKEVVGPGEE